jgi:hypothetical protein
MSGTGVSATAPSTVEAIVWSFRKRRTAALKEPDTRGRLKQMSDDQVVEVAGRLKKLPLERPWSDHEITELFIARTKCR